MKKLTYKQAYGKIIEAYFKDEIKPFNSGFCFCGTLCDNTKDWWESYQQHNPYGLYSGSDLANMETALLTPLCRLTGTSIRNVFSITSMGERFNISNHPNYETALFNGMSAALEVLKQIHKERGEDVEDFQFTKRQLV